MASLRTLRPLAHSSSRLVARNQPTKRFLNWASDKPMWTAHAKVSGGRQGHIEAPALNLDLGMPKAAGGAGDKTNPEELFAAGYGACFQGAMGATAPTIGVKLPEKPEDCIVETDVHLIGDLKKLDLGIRVDMVIKARGMEKADLEKLVEKTKTVCPYSRATAGNVITNTRVEIL